MSTILEIVKDSSSIPTYARRIATDTSGVYAQLGILYSATVPADTHIAIIGASVSFMISNTSFTPITAAGQVIPTGILVNAGAIWVKDITTIYYSTIAEGLINIEFYRILGKADY